MNEKIMDIISRLTTPEECDIVAKNNETRNPALALAAKRKAVQLRADKFGANNEVEKEALQAVYAYEETLFKKHGKRQRASRTWRMIKEKGIIPAVENTVTRKNETTGYQALLEMGMQDFAFEAVVCRHPEFFSSEALRCSKERLNKWQIDYNKI